MNDELLSVRDVMDTWGVTRSFIRQHVAYESHPARVLPELPSIAIKGRLFFTTEAVRRFSRAFHELHRPIHIKRGAEAVAAKQHLLASLDDESE